MRSLLYPAPSEPVPPAPPPYVDVTLKGHDGGKVSAWFASAPAALDHAVRPAILFLHGNGENLGTLVGSPFLDALWRRPAHLLVIDYPGYGRSAGTPSERSLIAAARAALRWLRAHAPDSPLFLVGWSLGAAVATQAAFQECADTKGERVSLQGLILLSPWSSLLDVAAVHAPRFLAQLVLRDRYETARDIAQIATPTLIIHGRYDELIPVDQARRVAASAAQLVAFEIVEHARHNDLLEQAETQSAVAELISQRSGS